LASHEAADGLRSEWKVNTMSQPAAISIPAITLFAQPYDISASGFYFSDAETYAERAAAARNDYGQPVEEFEIQFIDGEALDARLFEALGVNQANLEAFLEAASEWRDDQKVRVIIAVGEAGYSFDLRTGYPDDFDVDLYECDSLRDLAEQFVDEGLYGDIPESLRYYIDYDAIARDLRADYAETEIDGVRYVYACR
jgi:antirestriction protein